MTVGTRAVESLGHHLDDSHPLVLEGLGAGITLGQIVMMGTDWAVRRWERITGVDVDPSQFEPITRSYLDYAGEVSGAELLDSVEWVQLTTRAVDDWYAEGHDLLMMATVAEPPNSLGEL